MTEEEFKKIFNTPARRRCRDCAYLVEIDGKWFCDNYEPKDIEEIENCGSTTDEL